MFDYQMMILANYILTQNIFMVLLHKGLLTEQEGKEIIEQALLNLETQQHGLPQATAQYEGARALLEALRQAAFSGETRRPKNEP